MPPKAAAGAPAAKSKAKAKGVKKVENDEPDIEKVEAPDRTILEEGLAKIQEKIQALQAKQALLSTTITERSGGKDDFMTKKSELRGKLDELQGKISKLMERKSELQAAIGDKRQEGVEMRNQLNKMKKSIGFTSEADIDERIASLEFKLWTDTVSLKEEKEMLKEMQELRKNRPKVSQVNKMEDSLQNRDTGKSYKEQIEIINQQVTVYRDAKRAVSEEFSALMESRKEQMGDLPKIFEQREELSKQIQELIKERNELRDEFREKEKEYNRYRNELRQARQEKIQEERNAREEQYAKARRLKMAEKLDTQPHIQEMTLLEQTILFCKSLTASKGVEEKQEKKEISHDNPEGTQVLAKKEDRDEFYFVPTAKKKSKNKNKGAKGEGASKAIKHNAETFRLFDALKVDAPITTDDIPQTLEKLEAKLEDYTEKVKQWEQQREEMKRKILEEGYDPEADKKESKAEEAKQDDDAKQEEAAAEVPAADEAADEAAE